MPKNRTLEQLLEMHDRLEAALSSTFQRQERVRRCLYPAFKDQDKHYGYHHVVLKVLSFREHRVSKEYTLMITEFGYTLNDEGVGDTWHVEWYRDTQDLRFIEHVNGHGTSVDFGDLEKLAWEAKWRTLLRCSDEDQALAIEHDRLDRRIRNCQTRGNIVKREMQRCLQVHARALLSQMENSPEFSVVRVTVGDRILSVIKGERLILRDVVSNIELPANTLARSETYVDGSNFDIQKRRQKCKKRIRSTCQKFGYLRT